VAAVVPATRGDTLRVRLSFVADHWRIRDIGVRARVRRPEVRELAPAVVLDANERPDSAALRNLSDADTRYLSTTPGQRFTVRFDVGKGHGAPRTYLLAAQGYYTEWIPASWLRTESTTMAFTPGDTSLVLEMHRWAVARSAPASEDFISFIPVR
jgi:hypothetical protein